MGVVLWVLVLLTLPALKLAGVPPVAHWSWWQAACLLWSPWLVLLSLLLLSGLLRLFRAKVAE